MHAFQLTRDKKRKQMWLGKNESMKQKNGRNDTKISELHQIAPLQYWNIEKVEYQIQIKKKRLNSIFLY